MTSKAQIAANVRYNRKQDSITIRPSKADGAMIRAAAAAAGLPVQRYLVGLVRDRIAASAAEPKPDAEPAEADPAAPTV